MPLLPADPGLLEDPGIWTSLKDYDPNAVDFSQSYAGFSLDHPFSTDKFGPRRAGCSGRSDLDRDRLRGDVHDPRRRLRLGLGLRRRQVDNGMMRFLDALYGLPYLPFAIITTQILSPSGSVSVWTMVVALTIASWFTAARVVRGQVITLKENDYVRAAKAVGARWYRVLARHLLPNTLGILVIAIFLELPGVVLGEAFLSFIGLGINPPTAPGGRSRRTAARRTGFIRKCSSSRASRSPRSFSARTSSPTASATPRSAHAGDRLGTRWRFSRSTTSRPTSSRARGSCRSTASASRSRRGRRSASSASPAASRSPLSIMGLIPKPPAKIVGGEVLFDGRDLTKLSEGQMQHIRGNEVSMIFQDPMTSLNPTLKIGTQITETILAHRDVSRQDARKRAVELLDEVGIPRAGAPRRLSAPLLGRHEAARHDRDRALVQSALLIADEPTTALDVTIQAQILDLLDGSASSTTWP